MENIHVTHPLYFSPRVEETRRESRGKERSRKGMRLDFRTNMTASILLLKIIFLFAEESCEEGRRKDRGKPVVSYSKQQSQYLYCYNF